MMYNDLTKLKYLGENVIIGEYVKIINPDMIEIGDFSRIDDFSLLVGGSGITIGKYVHIASGVYVTGGGKLIMEDFSGVAMGSKIITGSDNYLGECITNPQTPLHLKEKHIIKGTTLIKKHAILGVNTVVMPKITIGEGAATGVGTIVTKDLDDWTVYIGVSKFYKKRKSDVILKQEKSI